MVHPVVPFLPLRQRLTWQPIVLRHCEVLRYVAHHVTSPRLSVVMCCIARHNASIECGLAIVSTLDNGVGCAFQSVACFACYPFRIATPEGLCLYNDRQSSFPVSNIPPRQHLNISRFLSHSLIALLFRYIVQVLTWLFVPTFGSNGLDI